uniref:Uncharacterized protein n=1 Tax=Serratia phage Spe5P4 TaxID=3159438 RepID=A0AAU7VHG9_9CAUD
MKQKQMVVDPSTSPFSSLNPGDAFIFLNDFKENCAQLFVVIEGFPNAVLDNWQEGYEIPNAVALDNSEHFCVQPSTLIIPVEAEASWRTKIVQ